MDFAKFKTYNFVPGICTVTIAKHGMGFSKKAISELGNPAYVKLLVNELDKQMALAVADKDEEGAIRCMEGKEADESRNFRLNGKSLLYKIAQMMDCSFEELNFKIVGEFFDDNRVMLIDLNKARKETETNGEGEE